VAGVTRDKDAGQAGASLVCGHVVEPVGDALTDLVDREPRDVADLQRIGAQHPPRGLDDLFLRNETERLAIGRVDLAQVDVEAHHVPALARDE
jgi:hypothetical protein